jgi:glycosyltransferase involved in cell wall biosynthesis
MINRKKKICFVIQRFGSSIIGGAESLCAQYVKQLLPFYDIEVVTSCSIDYNTWENVYSDGLCFEDDIKIHRFRSLHPRKPERVAEWTGKVYQDPYNDMLTGAHWLREVGPNCPGVMKHILENKDYYDLFVFLGYHYYTTTFGMPLVPQKSVFIPTAHDEDPIKKCNYFKYLFQIPRAIVYLTEEERHFVQSFFHNSRIQSIVAGAGVQRPSGALNRRDIIFRFALNRPYIVYAGRIDDSKNCKEMMEFFISYKESSNQNVKLVLMGSNGMQFPPHKDISYIGEVSEAEKFTVIEGARALIMPSKNESLSLSTLEAMSLGVPVLLNAHSGVLKSHVVKSNAGLYYYGLEDFKAALHIILSNEQLAYSMGENGKKYVAENYNWDDIVSQLRRLFEEVIQ